MPTAQFSFDVVLQRRFWYFCRVEWFGYVAKWLILEIPINKFIFGRR